MAVVMNFPGNVLAILHARIRWRVLVLLLASFIIAAGSSATAQDEGGNTNTLERGVKAAFLYKFLSYIEWPPAALPKPGSPFVIGVAGADTVAAELSQIARGRTVSGRPVTVKRIRNGESLSDLHMLFIGRGESARQAQLLKATQQHSIVTVTETEGALAQGSMINFRLADGRVRFDVSMDSVEKSDLKFSSRMLSIASSVHGVSRQ
jgi:hypothetical protein